MVRLNKRGYVDTGYRKYLRVDEFKAIEKYIKEKIKSPAMMMCIETIMYTGLRVSEVIGIKRENFNNDFSMLTIELKKSKKIKDRRIPRFLAVKLKDYYNRHNKRMIKENDKIKESRFMFYASYKNQSKNKHLQRTSIELKINQITDALGINQVYYKTRKGRNLHRITPHTFRHFAIWRYYKAAGNDLVAAQQIIGHTKPEVTAGYINALESANNENDITEKAFNF